MSRTVVTSAFWVVCSVGTLSVAPAPCAAQTSQPVVRELRGTFGASVNNLGAQQTFELSWRKPISSSPSVWWSEAQVSAGVTSSLTPAHARAGVWAEVAPVSPLVVRVGIERAYFFGTFNSLMSFDSRHDAFDTDVRKARGGAVSGTAIRLYARPTLRFRLGRIMAATSAEFERWSSNAAGPYFYEPTRDTLFDADGDRVVTMTSAVLYEHRRPSGGRLSWGLTHARMRVNNDALNMIQRMGVVVIGQSEGRILKLSQPSLTVLVANYLDDPSKQGGWTAALAIGVTLHRR